MTTKKTKKSMNVKLKENAKAIELRVQFLRERNSKLTLEAFLKNVLSTYGGPFIGYGGPGSEHEGNFVWMSQCDAPCAEVIHVSAPTLRELRKEIEASETYTAVLKCAAAVYLTKEMVNKSEPDFN